MKLNQKMLVQPDVWLSKPNLCAASQLQAHPAVLQRSLICADADHVPEWRLLP